MSATVKSREFLTKHLAFSLLALFQMKSYSLTFNIRPLGKNGGSCVH